MFIPNTSTVLPLSYRIALGAKNITEESKKFITVHCLIPLSLWTVKQKYINADRSNIDKLWLSWLKNYLKFVLVLLTWNDRKHLWNVCAFCTSLKLQLNLIKKFLILFNLRTIYFLDTPFMKIGPATMFYQNLQIRKGRSHPAMTKCSEY